MVAVRKVEVHPDEVHPDDAELLAPPALRLVPQAAVARPTAATYRRRRLVAAVVVALLSVAALRVASPVLGDPAVAPLEAGEVHVVQPGDTYWSIAAALDTDGDIRVTVDAISAANAGRALQVGDRLVLPS